MGKLVFMFPGQGSQYVGMGKEFYDTIPACKKVYDLASEASGLDIPGLCFEENIIDFNPSEGDKAVDIIVTDKGVYRIKKPDTILIN